MEILKGFVLIPELSRLSLAPFMSMNMPISLIALLIEVQKGFSLEAFASVVLSVGRLSQRLSVLAFPIPSKKKAHPS